MVSGFLPSLGAAPRVFNFADARHRITSQAESRLRHVFTSAISPSKKRAISPSSKHHTRTHSSAQKFVQQINDAIPQSIRTVCSQIADALSIFPPQMLVIAAFGILLIVLSLVSMPHMSTSTQTSKAVPTTAAFVKGAHAHGAKSSAFWGSVDANVDWCEKNYEVSPYIAEFYNTLSSAPIIFLGLFGAITSWKFGFKQLRFPLAFLTVALVGVGSFGFHATMRYYMQVLDELPMLYAVSMVLFILLKDAEHKQGPIPKLAETVTAANVIVSFIYVLFPSLYFIFFLSFSGAIAAAFIIALKRLKEESAPRLATQAMHASVYCYALGFGVWALENAICDWLPTWWKLHSLWHVASGIGTYLFIQFTIVLRAYRASKECYLDKRYIIPFVEVRQCAV